MNEHTTVTVSTHPRGNCGNASVVMYGCSPVDPLPLPDQSLKCVHGNPLGQCLLCTLSTVSTPWPLSSIPPPHPLYPCPTCNRHVVTGTLCPWCTKPEQADATKLKTALRKAIGALRDVSKATGGALEPLIAECEKALE